MRRGGRLWSRLLRVATLQGWPAMGFWSCLGPSDKRSRPPLDSRPHVLLPPATQWIVTGARLCEPPVCRWYRRKGRRPQSPFRVRAIKDRGGRRTPPQCIAKGWPPCGAGGAGSFAPADQPASDVSSSSLCPRTTGQHEP